MLPRQVRLRDHLGAGIVQEMIGQRGVAPQEESTHFWMSQRLKVQGLSSVTNIEKVEVFVDDLNDRTDLLRKSQGFVVVGMRSYKRILKGKSPLGHAIALEINHETGRYSIMDVNHGFYSFASYEQLRKGLGIYIREKYPRSSYDTFNADVYYPT